MRTGKKLHSVAETEKMKKNYKIPFQKTHRNVVQMMEYSSVFEPQTNIDSVYNPWIPDVWRDNKVFSTGLILDGCRKGRSAVRFYVIDESTHEHYSMGLQAFYDAVFQWGVRNKTIYGMWTFKKQGNNYSIIPVFKE